MAGSQITESGTAWKGLQQRCLISCFCTDLEEINISQCSSFLRQAQSYAVCVFKTYRKD